MGWGGPGDMRRGVGPWGLWGQLSSAQLITAETAVPGGPAATPGP